MRFDGLYLCAEADANTWLRFYEDGRVCCAAVVPEATTDEVASWLACEHAEAEKGFWSLRDGKLEFTLSSYDDEEERPLDWRYSGSEDEGELVVECTGPTGIAGERFAFVPCTFPPPA